MIAVRGIEKYITYKLLYCPRFREYLRACCATKDIYFLNWKIYGILESNKSWEIGDRDFQVTRIDMFAIVMDNDMCAHRKLFNWSIRLDVKFRWKSHLILSKWSRIALSIIYSTKRLHLREFCSLLPKDLIFTSYFL